MRDSDTMGERLELHRRMAGVVETSWSLGDIDWAPKELSTPQDPILAGAMEAHMPRGDYWAGLYNAKSTRHVRPQAALAFLHTVVRRDW